MPEPRRLVRPHPPLRFLPALLPPVTSHVPPAHPSATSPRGGRTNARPRRTKPMRGGHHAISGPAAWMALAGSATVRGHQAGLGLWALSSEQVLAGAVVATGAALLPDIDHPGATVSRSW